MKKLSLFLKCIAPTFLVAGCLHLFLGLNAEALLGIKLPQETITNAGLDSQNRFYGVTFMFYGVFLYLFATDISKYSLALKTLLCAVFFAGMARFISIYLYGSLPLLVKGLHLSEIIIPPIVFWCLVRIEKKNQT